MSYEKRRSLTLAEKIDILKFVEEHPIGIRAVAEEFNIEKTQVRDIIKNKKYLSQTFAEEGSTNSKRKLPKSDREMIDMVIFQWYLNARMNKLVTSGRVLKGKALELASIVGLNNFKASNGWLQKFKERHDIHYRNEYKGNIPSIIQSFTNEWLCEVKELIGSYGERDIFNCIETGLFFRILPEKTVDFINETCSEGNLSKERLTVMLCTNITGEFEKPLIIGKVGQDRCFKNINVNDIGVTWKSNNKAWMTRDIMTEWLLDLDHRMTAANRKIVLFLDDTSTHPLLYNLQSVKLIFFPPYIPFSCQPLGHGIIASFKMLYRQCVMRHQLVRMNHTSSLMRKINVLDAILWIKSATDTIPRTMVRHGFLKSGILNSNDREFKEENVDTDYKSLLIRLTGDESINYVAVDDKLLTENQSLDLIKIMQELIDPQVSDDDDEDIIDLT